MVATQVLISLCVAGMAVAAPQLALPGLQRTSTYTTSSVNEGQIVSNVVTALQPSIAEAVANALRSVQTTVGYTSGAGAINSNNAAAFANRQSSSFSSSAATGSVGAAFSSGAGASEEEVTARPEYNYEFKVANEDEQTYISQQEARDGDQLTGTYSYVDANGALVTVNYQAGPQGYEQTTDKQEGFVDVSARPVRVASTTANTASSSSSGSASRFSGASASRFSGATSGASRAVTSSASSSIDQSALIRQIVTALQPQIATSVNAALSSAQQRAAAVQRTSSVTSVAAAPVVRGGGASSTSAIFGDGYNVRIATPEFNIEY